MKDFVDHMDPPSVTLLQLNMQLCGHLDMVNVSELMAWKGQQLLEDSPADATNAACAAQGEFVANL